MFCQNCGTKLDPDAHFCSNCGSAQVITPPVQPQAEPSFAGKVLATAKKAGSSPAFLIATILFTLTLVLNLLPAGDSFAYEKLLGELGIADRDLPVQLKNLNLVTGILDMLPSLLITIGLWITYGTCVSRKPKVNTVGLTMIFVTNLVALVFSSLGLLAALFPCILFCIRTEDAFVQAMALGIGLTVVAVFAFVLIYYIKLCTTITNIRSTMKTGVPNKRVSRFVAVMCYIGGGFMILGGMGNLFNAGTVSLNSFSDDSLSYILPSTYFLSGISSLLSAAAQIIFGVLIVSYRSEMVDLETEGRMNTFKTLSYAEPYTAPVYIPPQPATEPEVVAAPAVIAEPAVTEESEVIEEPAVIEETE